MPVTPVRSRLPNSGSPPPMGSVAPLPGTFSVQAGAALDDLLGYESIEDPTWKGAFHQDGQLRELDLASAHQTSMTYDAMLRTTQVVNPDATFSRTAYEPLVTKSYDENDTDPASPSYDTPMVHYQDGLGRLVGVA